MFIICIAAEKTTSIVIKDPNCKTHETLCVLTKNS